MCKRLICLASFLLILGAVGASAAADVDPSLVGWWKFDDGSGDVALDSSGNSHEVTLLDGPTWGSDPEHRGILVLDGLDDHAYVDGTPFELPNYTIAIWFRVDGGSGTRDILSAKGPSGVNGVLLQIEADGTMRNLHRFPFASGGGSNIYTTDTYDDGSWHHAAAVKSASEMILYVDGRQVGTQPDSTQFIGPLGEIWLGTLDQRMQRMFPGPLDDWRIYNRVLIEQEILAIMEGEGEPLAYGPEPPDGAVYEQTWANLRWGSGDYAVSHDLYFGTNFNDVNDGAAGTFAGNVASNFQVVGFPGFPAPEGLQFGTTYYWRVDEVNDLHADSPWKGGVWSFTVPAQKAYDPNPADGAKFLNPPLILSWMPAFGSKLHHVYFGDNFDDIGNATGGVAQSGTTYDPGPLELGKTYYWRVDGFDGIETFRGDVWSFTTTTLGGGLKGEYFNNPNLSGDPVLTRIDPVIDFEWGAGSPDPNVVSADSFSVRWRGELEIAFTEAYRFYAVTEDGVKLWIDDQLVINRWYVYRRNEYRSDPIELQAGQKVSIEMWARDNDDTGETTSATAQLLWESEHQPKAIIPAAAFSLPVRAGSPNPANGAIDLSQTLELSWVAGEFAAGQDVYLGTDATGVADADTSTAGIYRGRQTQSTFSPGKLAWNTTYYWRIDAVNDVHPDSLWKGPVWSFTTADFLIVDNFESCTDNDADGEAIWQHWIDGFGVADNGSLVGYLLPPYAEQTIVHSGFQSMPLFYDNTAGVRNSEAELTLTAARDWTEEGVSELSLWFRGYPASVGGFTEGPVGSYTMTAAGTDISGTADQFHFTYKTLTGAGAIVARVDSVSNTDPWAKAGVMIRETLDAGSKHAFACITLGNGVASQGRTAANAASFSTNQTGITTPRWVKLERDAGGNFTVSHSANGTTWEPAGNAIPTNIPMTSNVYVGLALTSHNVTQMCEAKFSNVSTTGTVSGQWAHQDIGIASNNPEPLYVVVSNPGAPGRVVVHDDASAATIDTWTEWVIPLQTFADRGIDLTNVDRIAVGLGTRGNQTAPGGSGKMYFDDIRLYRPRSAGQ
ncbi:MAG: LamG-like jellyroll fold domain-containing protein [Planctomycetota bacterium]